MIICVDIGGGTTRVGFSSDKKTFENIIKFPTPEDFGEEMNKINEVIKKSGQSIEKISFGAAGSVDGKNGKMISWGQRKEWKGRSFFDLLSNSFPDSEIVLGNDANVACLGEAVFGAGRNYSLVGYLTLSTGVGGGLVIDKKILPHKIGMEPGDLILNPQGPEGLSHKRGVFEAYASGTAFQKMFGMKSEECNDPAIWEKYSEYLSMGVANVLFMWSPEVLIFGGGVSNKFDSFIKPLREKLAVINPSLDVIDIVKAELDEPGLYGGLAL